MVCGMPPFFPPLKTCEGCVVEKQPRKVFKTISSHRSKQTLEVVYSDVCGPIDNDS